MATGVGVQEVPNVGDSGALVVPVAAPWCTPTPETPTRSTTQRTTPPPPGALEESVRFVPVSYRRTFSYPATVLGSGPVRSR